MRNNVTVGQPENSALVVTNDAVVTVGNQFTIGSGGALTLTSDGVLITDVFHHSSGGTFLFANGRLGFNTFNGDLATSSGTIDIATSLSAGEVHGDYTQGSGASLEIEIDGTESGEFDQLLVDDVAQLGGTLKVSLSNSYNPQAGDSIPLVVTMGGVSGMFDTFDLPALGPNLEWLITQDVLSVLLLVNSTLEADFNNDGDVGHLDPTTWEADYGEIGSAGREDGDADGDLDVDGADFLPWQRQFTGDPAPPLSASTTVPESSSIVLLVGLVALLFAHRQRRFV